MEFLAALQNSAFGVWVASAPTLWAYPGILVLHTVGLAIVVGASAVVDLRLLGVGDAVPLRELRGAFRAMWMGFAINAASGVALFIAAAVDTAMKPVFWVKLSLILLALLTAGRIRRLVFRPEALRNAAPIPGQARFLAVTSLILWAGAIAAGRWMAYTR